MTAQIVALVNSGIVEFLLRMVEGDDAWVALAVYNGEWRGGAVAIVRYA